ncbi:hypothetical protein VP01_763g2 [Puccinia sorghi]|uniref:Uncharacterized protein n=1 Tax=Puccinia sorghi TaxID=27349 RepID=A0A0L6UBQ9_9BASI|nr:hypothetical protein VP01_763g2 [Puccinia sorghi]
MASVKVVSLLIKTLSKPIANRLKLSAQVDHTDTPHLYINQISHRLCWPCPISSSIRKSSNLGDLRTSSASDSATQVCPINPPLRYESHPEWGQFFIRSVPVLGGGSPKYVMNHRTQMNKTHSIVAENLRGRMQTAHRRDVVDERLTELESLCANIRSVFCLTLSCQAQEDASLSNRRLSTTASQSSQGRHEPFPLPDDRASDHLDRSRPQPNVGTPGRTEIGPGSRSTTLAVLSTPQSPPTEGQGPMVGKARIHNKGVLLAQ